MANVNKKTVLSLLVAFFTFMILNIPSIKLLYSSNLINFGALAGLMFFGMVRALISNEVILEVGDRQLRYVLAFFALWLALFAVTWFVKPGSFDVVDFIKYLSVILFTLGTFMFIEKEDLKFIVLFQILWGVVISLAEWTVGIPKDSSLGQHYLISGVVIAATFVLVVGLLIAHKISIHIKLYLLPVLIVLFLGLTSLPGRAPILLSLSVPVFVFLVFIVMEKNLKKKMAALLFITVIITFAVIVLFNILDEQTIARFSRIIVSIQDEPRFDVYASTLSIIMENPEGVGLLGYETFELSYPHNIFMEIVLSGGLLTIIPFLVIITDQALLAVKVIKKRDTSIIWLNMALYFFFTWNISFELTSSYMVFVPIVLFIKSAAYNSVEVFNPATYNIEMKSKRRVVGQFNITK